MNEQMPQKKMDKHCPACVRAYEGTFVVCPNDGTLLIPQQKIDKRCPACERAYEGKLVVCEYDGTLLIPVKADFSLITDPHLNDRYEVERIIHGGTNSIFTQAKDWQNSCAKVGIKVLTDIHDSDYRSARKIERFERQIERQQKLDHKNIVRILDHGKSKDGYSFIVFEFIDGFSLAKTKNAIKYLPIKYLLRALCQTCDALSYAAENGVVHNDLSPNDILLYGDPSNNLAIKITDFSKGSPLLHSDNRSLQLTEHRDYFGSPEYMSPEAGFHEELDQRSNVYSLGCILLETISTKSQLVAEHWGAVLLAKLESREYKLYEPWLDVEISAKLEAIINRCLQRQRDDRYQTLIALKKELEILFDPSETLPFDVLHKAVIESANQTTGKKR